MTGTSFEPRRRVSRLVWPAAALGLLLLFNFLFTDGFFALEVRDGRLYGSLVDVLDRATPVILVALGMTLVIGTGGIDLSVGAVMAIAGAMAAALIAQPDFSPLTGHGPAGSFAWALAIALVVSALAGAGNGLLVTAGGVQPIVATLILMVAGRGVAQLLTSGQIVTVRDPAFAWLGNGAFLGVPVTITVALVALLVVGVLVRATALGLFIEAVGGNPVASRSCGVRAGGIRLLAYVVCGGLAGVAGILAAADIQAADANNAGLYIELDAILAVVIGGTALTGGRFSLVGSVLGALLIQSVTTTILSRGVAVELTLIVKAAVVIAVCLLQSERFRRDLLRPLGRTTRKAPA